MMLSPDTFQTLFLKLISCFNESRRYYSDASTASLRVEVEPCFNGTEQIIFARNNTVLFQARSKPRGTQRQISSLISTYRMNLVNLWKYIDSYAHNI